MILLIRHCTPDIDYSNCKYEQALIRLDEYNNIHKIKIQEILDIKDKIQNITNLKNIKSFCSISPRASITADNFFPKGTNIIKSDEFVEFDLSIFPIPFLKFGIRTWFSISRILWFIGILKTERTFQQERERANRGVELLNSNAKTTDVALVAHGLLNLFIEKGLKKKGWRRTQLYSSGCFSIKVLEN